MGIQRCEYPSYADLTLRFLVKSLQYATLHGNFLVIYVAPTPGNGGPLPELTKAKPGNATGIEIPACLLANVERHCAHLRSLVQTLGNAGVDEATIEASISQIVRSYEAELLLNIKNLHKDAVNA